MHLIQDGIWLCVKGKCELQPKSFTNSYKLQKHQELHADVLCEKCEKPFGTKQSLQRYIDCMVYISVYKGTNLKIYWFESDEALINSCYDILSTLQDI